MSCKVVFQGMEHSQGLEAYSKEKVSKLDEFLKNEDTPHFIEFHLKSHPDHAHQEAVLHVKTKNLNLISKTEDPDMYKAIDDVTDKMISLIKKEKEKISDSQHKVKNEKNKFYK